MSFAMTISKRRSYTILLLIVAIFVLPIVLACVFYQHQNMLSSDTTNHGALITPPRNMNKLSLIAMDGNAYSQQALRGHWVMLYVVPGACNQNCQVGLYNMRQVRLATGKDMDRVERVLLNLEQQPMALHLPEALQTEYAGTIAVSARADQFQQLMGNLPSTKLALTHGYLYLVDPLGNIMMGYAPDANASGMFKDLQRLLKVSQIG